VAFRDPIDSFALNPMSQLSSLSVASSSAPPGKIEFDLLCALARAELDADQKQSIANWNYAALDWSEFLRVAKNHGILALAARNLLECGRELPPEVERLLRIAYEENLKRSLWFTAELVRIVQHLESKQLQVVPFKGPVLAETVYRDRGLRSYSDLDFLVSSGDVEQAKLALGEIGYRPSTDLTPAVERFWLRKGNERAFDGSAGRNLVELQWALLPDFNAVDLRVKDLIIRASRVLVGGCEMSTLSPEDLLLVLCLHAAKHLWSRLIWLTDIAEALRTQTVDYALMFSRTRALGIAHIVGVSLWLAKNVLRAQLPQAAEGMMAAESGIPELGREFAERLARGATYDFESTGYFRLMLKLRERRRDRWRYMWRLFWTPGVGDMAVVNLPEALFPLYRVIRIGRLLAKLT
jgi:hypothetical protein